MNYVILNGVKSTLIKGLMIQELPPVSKPLIRTKREEIDGRDGDIVTKLGYSAYDKEMSIGLFGDFDIDEVIAFFDSEGAVIFSNEPDKYYLYEIYEQIDFERLIRFRTATVKFHVQPFKFSAVDDAVEISKNKFRVKPYSTTKNGITISVENAVITVSGTTSANTEIYVPLDNMYLEKGLYTLQADCGGIGETNCSIRIIGKAPNDADSFGHTAIQLDSSVEITSNLIEDKVFNYIWFSIPVGKTVDFDLYLQVFNDQFNSIQFLNRGNTLSKPIITMYGSGNIALKFNGKVVFSLNLEDAGYITLDGIEMNAYKGDVLMNRSVSGDFNDLVLKSGMNEISWIGNVTQILIQKGSRWI